MNVAKVIVTQTLYIPHCGVVRVVSYTAEPIKRKSRKKEIQITKQENLTVKKIGQLISFNFLVVKLQFGWLCSGIFLTAKDDGQK